MKKIVPLVLTIVLSSLPQAGAQFYLRDSRYSFANIAPGEADKIDPKSFSAKITLSSESGIPYGGAYVRIFNSSGIPVFKFLCEKPWIFVKLPAGDYNIVAVDRKKIQRISPLAVKKEGLTVVKLTWPTWAAGY